MPSQPDHTGHKSTDLRLVTSDREQDEERAVYAGLIALREQRRQGRRPRLTCYYDGAGLVCEVGVEVFKDRAKAA